MAGLDFQPPPPMAFAARASACYASPMTRRPNPARDLAEKTWPIRVCIRVPSLGFAGAGIDPHRWLTKELGSQGYAMHSAGRARSESTAVYFRTLEDAARFLAAFPSLELADDTSPAPGIHG